MLTALCQILTYMVWSEGCWNYHKQTQRDGGESGNIFKYLELLKKNTIWQSQFQPGFEHSTYWSYNEHTSLQEQKHLPSCFSVSWIFSAFYFSWTKNNFHGINYTSSQLSSTYISHNLHSCINKNITYMQIINFIIINSLTVEGRSSKSSTILKSHIMPECYA